MLRTGSLLVLFLVVACAAAGTGGHGHLPPALQPKQHATLPTESMPRPDRDSDTTSALQPYEMRGAPFLPWLVQHAHDVAVQTRKEAGLWMVQRDYVYEAFKMLLFAGSVLACVRVWRRQYI